MMPKGEGLMSGSKKLAALFLIILVHSFSLYAETFSVESYSVDISVDASKKLAVNEDMDLYFTSPSHGLIRDVQYDFGRTRIKVSDVHGEDIADTERNGGFLSIIMGDPDRYITGPASFSFGYSLQYPADEYPDYDELYYNIVSPGYWDCDMDFLSFSVSFPAPVDKDRIWVTYGPYGSSARLPFGISEDGMTVYGRYSSLPAGYGITLRAEMDEWKALDLNKPFVFTEYGADTLPSEHKLPSVMWSQEYQNEVLELQHRVFDSYDFIRGEQVWNFADFQTTEGLMRVNGNKKGIFTRQRQPKDVAFLLKKRWESLPLDYKA